MKKFLTLIAVAGLVLGGASAVYANVCAMDQVPAASLLFPFVVYDYNAGADGQTTIFSVTNVSSEAMIVHFTLWTDYSAHILDWNVVLSGYDTQQQNIRDILMSGRLPVTGTNGETPDSVYYGGCAFEQGPMAVQPAQLPQPDGVGGLAARCNAADYANYPGFYVNALSAPLLNNIKSWLVASQVVPRAEISCSNGNLYDFTNYWFTSRTTADPTWMYITADVVYTCNSMFPEGDPAYWVDSTGQVPTETGYQGMYDNVLIGDTLYTNPMTNFSEAVPAVHLEADVDLPTPIAEGFPVSFYHQYSAADCAVAGCGDFREPLASAYGFRWMNDATQGLQTWVQVFKRATLTNNFTTQSPATITDLFLLNSAGNVWSANLDQAPPSMMLAWDCEAYTYYVWDEDENCVTTTTGGGPSCPPGDPNCYSPRINLLPLETQEVEITQFNIPTTSAGWMLIVWPWSNNQTWDDWFQTYVQVKYKGFGTYSAALPAAVMANFNCFPAQALPNLGINYDYVMHTNDS